LAGDNTHSINEPNSSFLFAFIWKIAITHCSLRSRTDVDSEQPLSWALEGSLHGAGWTALHGLSGVSDLRGMALERTYECETKGVFNAFRLTMTGPNSLGKNFFVQKKIELFGELFSWDMNQGRNCANQNGCGFFRMLLLHFLSLFLTPS
jgi:hypothetical protein